MDIPFSVSMFQDGILIFYLISTKDQIIHLTASLIKHEKAIAKLDAEYPGIGINQSSNKEPFIKFIHNIINDPDHRLSEPDFKSNPFLSAGTKFQQQVWHILTRIKYGQTVTYKELASMAGRPKSARAVGNACNANPLALIIPCHRVVGVNGLGGYAGGNDIKSKLLDTESRNINN